MYWGVKELKPLESNDFWDASIIGEAVLDTDLDMSDEKAQVALLQLCADLHKQEMIFDD